LGAVAGAWAVAALARHKAAAVQAAVTEILKFFTVDLLVISSGKRVAQRVT